MFSEYSDLIMWGLGSAAAIVVWAVREEGKRQTMQAALEARIAALESRQDGLETLILRRLDRIDEKLDRKVDK